MNAHDALADYVSAAAKPDPRFAFPDANTVAERREACASCVKFIEMDGLLHCTGCLNCKGKPRMISFTTARTTFDCPAGRWRA